MNVLRRRKIIGKKHKIFVVVACACFFFISVAFNEKKEIVDGGIEWKTVCGLKIQVINGPIPKKTIEIKSIKTQFRVICNC